MNRLEDLLHELATESEPPARLRVAEVYAAGRRRHRRIVWTRIGALAAAVLVITVAASIGLRPDLGAGPTRMPGDTAATSTPPSVPPAIDWAPASLGGHIRQVLQADATTLYAVVSACDDDNCPQRLLASTDGGRTWAERFRGTYSYVRVYGPETLSTSLWDPSSGSTVYSVSTDGGRTWRPTVETSTPAAVVPDGGWLNSAAKIVAIDPSTGRSAALKAQPPITVNNIVRAPGGTSWWACGKAANLDPAIAISHDRGRTWMTRTFTDAERSWPGYPRPAISADGRTAIVVVPGADGGDQRPQVYRTADSGATWTQVDTMGTLPDQFGAPIASYLAADGTHVVGLAIDNELQAWASRDGGAGYARFDRPGLADSGVVPDDVLALDGSGYVISDSQGAYRSTDGITWTRIAKP